RHDAVAGVLVDGPLVSVNTFREDPEQAIEQAMPFLGIDALRELHRAHDVGEEDGDQLALAPEHALGRKDLLGEMSRRVGTRVGGDGGRREVRATIVAEPGASGVLVATRSAAHWALAHLPLIRVSVAPDHGVLRRMRVGERPVTRLPASPPRPSAAPRKAARHSTPGTVSYGRWRRS